MSDQADLSFEKKRKVDESDNCQSKLIFTNFKTLKVLREDANSKSVTLQGYFEDTGEGESAHAHKKSSEEDHAPALVILERKPFDTASIQHSLQTSHGKEILKNDIYSSHDVFSNDAYADSKAFIIHPATEKHITKYSDHPAHIIRETPELYETVTLPCLMASKFSLQWVYNIIEKKAESERIIMELPDPNHGFVLIPDLKWDGKNVETLYLVAIAYKHGIKSLRDLRTEHLPLLTNILDDGLCAIEEKYGVKSDMISVYIHYQPSYYHFHVHFTHVKWPTPGFNTLRSHLLQDVIDNIDKDSEYYAKKNISYIVRENDQLYKAYKEAGYFEGL